MKYKTEYLKQKEAYKAKMDSIKNHKESKIQKYHKKQLKQFVLNIIYYDESLKDKGENSDNCAFFRMNTKGTFYGCHNLDLFKIVCEKIKKMGRILFYYHLVLLLKKYIIIV